VDLKNMFIVEKIDNLLNYITMYKAMVYGLMVLLGWGMFLAVIGKVPYTPFEIAASVSFLTAVCWSVNKIFGWAFDAVVSSDSSVITAMILSLIISPQNDIKGYVSLFWIGVISMFIKYLLAIKTKHVFNPAAGSAVIMGFATGFGASWWVGNGWMAPVVIVSGILIARKIKRAGLIISFFVVGGTISLFGGLSRGGDLMQVIEQNILYSPILFFAFYMLTEPLTTPGTKKLRILYGIFVGILFLPRLHIGDIYMTPELALVIGNIFSFAVDPRKRFELVLKEKISSAHNIYDYVFEPNKPVNFNAGQYMEWTLEHKKVDARGKRRYFTIASAPQDKNVRIGVKFNENGSSFKGRLLDMKPGDRIIAADVAGDFILPKDQNKKLVFMAGGIGVTPFRSMIEGLIEKSEKRDIVLIYANATKEEIAYKEIFDEAEEKIRMKTFYVNTHVDGRVDEEKLKTMVSDLKERRFYLSGPHAMVEGYRKLLLSMKVKRGNIVTDYFPGF
jgi:glycine betaine catabolism B